MKTRIGMGCWLVCALVAGCSESRKPSDGEEADAAAVSARQRHDDEAKSPVTGGTDGGTKAGIDRAGDGANNDKGPGAMGTGPMDMGPTAGTRGPGMPVDGGCRMPMPGDRKDKDAGPKDDAAAPPPGDPGHGANDPSLPECGPGMHGDMPHDMRGMPGMPGMAPPPAAGGMAPPPPPPDDHGAPPPPPPDDHGAPPPPPAAGGMAPPPPHVAGAGAPPPPAGHAAPPPP